MRKYPDWSTWMPQKDGGVGNGEYNHNDPHPYLGGTARKITIISLGEMSPPATKNYPTHFSVDPRPNGKAYQHIDLDKPGYRLGTGGPSPKYQANANKDAGINIQVNILGLDHTKYTFDEWWDDAKYRRLAWWLSKICTSNGVPKKFPRAFGAHKGDKNNVRMAWNEYNGESGIFGMEHSPYDNDLYSPGRLNIQLLGKYILDTNITNANEPGGDAAKDTADFIREAEAAESAAAAETVTDETTPLIEETPMEGKVFRFNPPLHKALLPQRVEFSSSNPGSYLDTHYFDERGLPEGTTSVEDLMSLRLGRIIQHERAAGMAATNTERYGFRFLYNPTSITIASSRNDSVILDPRSSINAVISGINQNFQTIRMSLFLMRLPDVLGDTPRKSDYLPSIYDEDLAGVRTYGTHWDLEILYRVCNGIFTLEDRGRTADIGVIVPSNARMILGPNQNYFGFVESVNYNDRIFSKDMVPVVTDVDIVFRRHVDMAPGALTSFYSSLGELGGGSGGAGTVTTSADTDTAGTGATSGTGSDPMALFHKNGLNAGWTYGNKDPNSMAVKGGKHRAWDIEAKYEGLLAGVDGVVAAMNDGVTKEEGGPGSPSNWIVIHINTAAGPASVYYQHLSNGLGCKVGQVVTPTTYLGKTGNTGYSTGPHLHLAVSKGHVGTDRYRYLNSDQYIYPPSAVFPK